MAGTKKQFIRPEDCAQAASQRMTVTAIKATTATCIDIARAAGLSGGIEKNGEIYFAAPYREDRNPSLRINTDKDCWFDDPVGRGGNYWSLTAAILGVDPNDKPAIKAWLNDHNLSNGNGSKPGRIVAEYNYRNAAGEIVFQVVRKEPGKNGKSKGFSQRRPDGNGGWIPGTKGIALVPYRLDEWIEKDTVFITEGEKHADLLWKRQIPATTNLGGTGMGWRPGYNEHLAGKNVAILPDNDDAGRNHAQTVARNLGPVARAVKIIELPELPEKGDIVDWFEAGHTKKELLKLVLDADTLTADSIPNTESKSEPGTEEGGPVPVLVRLSDVEPEEVEWYWKARLAKGKLTLFIGDPGLGKSTITLDAASRISTGSPWPDGALAPKGSTVLLSAEDGIADTIRRRVDILGGDPSKIHVLTAVRDRDIERPFSLVVDVPQLERALVDVGDVRLIVVDPISAYLGSKDSYKDSEIRGVLTPLAALAEKYGVAVIGILHLTKNGQQKALHRALGSVAFVAAARTVFAVGQDPDDPSRRVLVGVKNNLAAEPDALAFRIIEDGRLVWEGAVDGADAETILSSGGTHGERTERNEAKDFLEDLLKDGSAQAKEIQRLARESGISDSTLRRAKADLNIGAKRVGGAGKDGQWVWCLPKVFNGANEPAKMLTNERVNTLAQANETKPISSDTSTKMLTFPHVSTLGEHLSKKPASGESVSAVQTEGLDL